MNIRMRVGAIAVAAAGALGLGVLGAGSALAGTGVVTAVTHTMNHPDTTYGGLPGTACTSSPGGSVWAHDNLALRYRVTPEATPGLYAVTIYAAGSFQAFADPNTCYAADFNGSVRGWLTYDVQSSAAPDPANVPAQQPSGDTSQSTILVDQLFGGNAAIVGGGQYSYTYNRVDGTKYQQSG